MTDAHFPLTRLRRLRQSHFIRALVQENTLEARDLIWPLFICEGENVQEPILSMPGVSRYSIDQIITKAHYAHSLNIPAIALFPRTPERLKDAKGQEALNAQNLVCLAVKAVKASCPDIGIICDVALDPYTDHGHDGVFNDAGNIDNDKTIELLVQQAALLAEAGCDILAPSDMMDGRVGAIRKMLEKHHYHDMLILSYAAKYASAFYGPFREAVGAGQKLGEQGKKTYQMNPANAREALREVTMDIHEGADMVMVKPGMPYLDIVKRVADLNIPCFAYHTSGEYAMLMAAIEAGWLDPEAAIAETLLAFKRAGATGILTYLAADMAEKLAHQA